FYLDSPNGFLYYVPRAGQDLTKASVELPLLASVVEIKGAPGHLVPRNDDDAAATYDSGWSSFGGRGYGDVGDDVHATQSAAGVSIGFTGTGLDVLAELDPDHGAFTASVVD